MIPSHSGSLSPLEEVVLLTVAYTDQFHHPLTAQEVLERCLRPKAISKVKPSLASISQILLQLKKKKLLDSCQEFYFLPGREETVGRRNQREVWAAERGSDVEKVVSFCHRLPWICAVYITGSLAMKSVDLVSDVDFMLIVQPKRLWLTRVLVSLFAQLHGKRRSWNHEEPASWCFNLWLDTDHLRVGEQSQDIYRAYEVLQAQCVFDRRAFDERFKSENEWVNQFVFQTEKRVVQKGVGERGSFLDSFDWLAWQLQTWYMKRHQTREKVGRGFAFFHPRDTKKLIYHSWLISLQRCLPKILAAEILQKYV